MNPVLSNFKIYGLSLGCMMCGAMLVDILDSIEHHRFRSYYQAHSIGFWFSLFVNLAVIYLLARRARQLFQARSDPRIPEESAGLAHSMFGVGFRTTAFVRICVYIGFYLLGIGLIFFV